MPTVTASDAPIKAAEVMPQAVKYVFPMSGPTQDAIEQLMTIFKEKARQEVNSATVQRIEQLMTIFKEKARQEVNSATVQRVLRKDALSQRVYKEAEHASEDAEMHAESTTPED